MRHAAVCLLCLSLVLAPAFGEPVVTVPAPDAPLKEPASTLRSRISDEAIRNAVKASLAESRENPRRHEADTITATPYETFGQTFSEAKVPDCLHPDALKRQPTFFLAGLFAVPFVAVAKLRGKCN